MGLVADRSPWSAATVAAGVALVGARAARPPTRSSRFDLLRTRVVAVASAALFLATAALFAVTVFVPLFLQTTTGATPTEAGLLLVPAMLGITVSTTLAGRSVARTGRYKRFPVAGLALMAAGLALLAVVAGDPSRPDDRDRPGRVRARLRDGRADPDHGRAERRRAARAGRRHGGDRLLPRPRRRRRRRDPGRRLRRARGRGREPRGRPTRVQTVFLAGAALAALALVVVLALREVPLRGPGQ